MSLNIAVEVIRNQVVVTVLAHSCNHGAEIVGAAKRALLNLLEDLVKVSVDAVGTIGVRVAQVINIFGKVAEEEDVVLSNLTSDFNLW